MKLNSIVYALAAIVPMFIGAIWYGPLFGKAWMKQVDLTKQSMKGVNMPLIFAVVYLCSFLIAFFLQFIVIHQWGIFSTLAGEVGFDQQTGDAFNTFTSLMENYGDRFRTFKHGMLHGATTGVFLATPIITIKALFEQKKATYITINAGYWIVTLALMGGIICKWM